MTKINVKGLEIRACHGVLPFEKQQAQPFIFDVELGVDFQKAAVSDNVKDTVNYAEVCEEIKSVALSHSFNLIESLAWECAIGILEKFPFVSTVNVAVDKPEAPIDAKFNSVGVSCYVERQNVVLSLGSSMGNKQNVLDRAISMLDGVRGIKVKRVSDYITTQPYGGVAHNEFLNCAIVIECLLSPRRLLEEINDIENRLGRVRGTRWDDRTADIDIIFFGNKVIAEEGLIIPHPDYFNRDFVLIPVKQIAPDFVCPVKRKMMRDM